MGLDFVESVRFWIIFKFLGNVRLSLAWEESWGANVRYKLVFHAWVGFTRFYAFSDKALNFLFMQSCLF